jgi:hypothetical protein
LLGERIEFIEVVRFDYWIFRSINELFDRPSSVPFVGSVVLFQLMSDCWLLSFDRMLLLASSCFAIPAVGLLDWMLVASF